MNVLISHIIPMFTVLVLVFSTLINFRSLGLQARLKEMDVVMRCQDKFNRLVYELAPKWPDGDKERFAAHYWMLQADQFLYYQRKWISKQIYLHWIEHRYYNFLKNAILNVGTSTISYTELWSLGKPAIKDISFINLMDIIAKKAENRGEFDYQYFAKTIRRLPKVPFAGGRN